MGEDGQELKQLRPALAPRERAPGGVSSAIMPNSRVDQFESIFQRASKTPYEHQPLNVSSVLIISDLEGEAAKAFETRVRAFLATLMDEGKGEPTVWTSLGEDDFKGVDGLLGHLEATPPSLICTYRSLRSQAWRWSTTLGKYVDILAQETAIPVLLFPHPRAEAEAPDTFRHGKPSYGAEGTRTVMALTDHLTGDHRLIHWSVRFTQPGGSLVLTHVEDGLTFERYMTAISKIPDIDTEEAREMIAAQLLREPHDYIGSCAKTLSEADPDLEVREVVVMGHRLQEYTRLVEEHGVDLLVLNTKDKEQLAMHGLAYPLVVELRHIPTLML